MVTNSLLNLTSHTSSRLWTQPLALLGLTSLISKYKHITIQQYFNFTLKEVQKHPTIMAIFALSTIWSFKRKLTSIDSFSTKLFSLMLKFHLSEKVVFA